MGYFSNGTEGMGYRDRYCDRCKHDINEDCAVWLAHLVANYEECNKKESVLHILIPRSEDGLRNEQCRMFVERDDPEYLGQQKLL